MKFKKIITTIFICSLAFGVMAQKKEWKNATETNTIKSYYEFLQTYPKSRYAKKAILMLQELEYEKIKKFEDIEILKQYVNKYPQSPHNSGLRNKIKHLENAYKLNDLVKQIVDSKLSLVPPSIESTFNKTKEAKKYFQDFFSFEELINSVKNQAIEYKIEVGIFYPKEGVTLSLNEFYNNHNEIKKQKWLYYNILAQGRNEVNKIKDELYQVYRSSSKINLDKAIENYDKDNPENVKNKDSKWFQIGFIIKFKASSIRVNSKDYISEFQFNPEDEISFYLECGKDLNYIEMFGKMTKSSFMNKIHSMGISGSGNAIVKSKENQKTEKMKIN